MDQAVPATSSLTASIPGLTVVIIFLVPCLLLVLLLNCLLLGHKLLTLLRGKKQMRTSSQCSLLQSTRQRVSHFTERPSYSGSNGVTSGQVYRPISAMHLASPLISSSREHMAGRRRSMQPDGATCFGSGSLPATNAFSAAMSTTSCSTAGPGLPGLPRRAYYTKPVEWQRVPMRIPHSSDSDVERVNTVPPNSPVPECCAPVRRSSTAEIHSDIELGDINQVHMECEVASSIPPESSYFIASTGSSIGPGLDSDFGASAGVSVRIVSGDGEEAGGDVWAPALEWDYYDPSYITQNQLPPRCAYAPRIAPKQYWI